MSQNPATPGGSPPAAPARASWDARSLALVAVFAALIAAAALAPAIPVGGAGVPITLQTLAVMLTGLVLGGRRAGAAVGLYLLLGLAGLPIFSQGRSGLQVLAGPSAGYIVAFFLAALLVGFAAEYILRSTTSRLRVLWFFLAATVVSVIVVHGLGILGMMLNLKLSWTQAFLADLPFYPGDVLKNLVAAVAAAAVHRAFPEVLLRKVRRTPGPTAL